MTLLPIQIESIVKNALLEDLGQGDVTTDILMQEMSTGKKAHALIRAREACILSGIEAAVCVFRLLDPALEITQHKLPGQSVQPGDTIMLLQGAVDTILKGERTALNFMQHLTGVATETGKFVDALSGTTARLTDTRKTIPGLRLLEKKAVIDGGGYPHRFNLSSAVMLKDNHIQWMGGIRQAVGILRRKVSHTITIEVEADTLDQVREAVEAGADIILLDNMTIEQVRQAVLLVDGRAVTESSGNISLATVRQYGETGVQYISTSKITMGARAIDIGLDLD